MQFTLCSLMFAEFGLAEFTIRVFSFSLLLWLRPKHSGKAYIFTSSLLTLFPYHLFCLLFITMTKDLGQPPLLHLHSGFGLGNLNIELNDMPRNVELSVSLASQVAGTSRCYTSKLEVRPNVALSYTCNNSQRTWQAGTYPHSLPMGIFMTDFSGHEGIDKWAEWCLCNANGSKTSYESIHQLGRWISA